MPVRIYKNVGETPLEALERYRAGEVAAGRSGLTHAPMTYAGRLDPMAEGELLILVGDECRDKERWLRLDKEYEVEIVLGLETDTYDGLGMAERRASGAERRGDAKGIDSNSIALLEQNLFQNAEGLQQYVGRFRQEYPPFSSRTFQGKPLHELTRVGQLPETAEMPTKEVEIYSIDLLEQGSVSADDLMQRMFSMIDKVKGDFRQEEIKQRWRDVLRDDAEQFRMIKIRVKCSSGTYMRSLAHRMGGFAVGIKRTEICASALG